MISPECNIHTFINYVKDIDLKEEILGFCVLEYKSAEQLLYRSKKGEKHWIRNYVDVIKGLGWFLQTESKPAGVSDQDFELYRPIIEDLVKKGQINPEVLELFK